MKFELDELVFTGHATRRMFDESIRPTEARLVVQRGRIIRQYPDDKPFPSYLLLGFVRDCPIHVVIGYDIEAAKGYVVTAYRPEPELWTEDFTTRRRL